MWNQGYLERAPSTEQMRLAYPSPEGELKPGDLEKGILRENRGETDRTKSRSITSCRTRSTVGTAGQQRSLSSLSMQLRRARRRLCRQEIEKFAGQLRTILDQRRDTIRNLRPGALDQYRGELLSAHMGKAFRGTRDDVDALGQGRSARGPASFLKQRTFDTVREGVEAGLKPVTYNPVELMLLKFTRWTATSAPISFST